MSSIVTAGPALAPPDDDDRIGPDSFNNEDRMFPEPADAIGAPASFKSAFSSESLRSSDAGAVPPLKPPLKPPKPPAELPLSAPNFDVIAAIFGEMTACNNC